MAGSVHAVSLAQVFDLVVAKPDQRRAVYIQKIRPRDAAGVVKMVKIEVQYGEDWEIHNCAAVKKVKSAATIW